MMLMGVLVALLSACGPPDPGMMQEEETEEEFSDTRFSR
jgi:hypothetical protein